jgi:hypothetical protein
MTGSGRSVFLSSDAPPVASGIEDTFLNRRLGMATLVEKARRSASVVEIRRRNSPHRRSSAKEPLTFFLEIYLTMFDLLGLPASLLSCIDENLSNYMPPSPLRSGGRSSAQAPNSQTGHPSFD